jgi:serine protease AprX
LSSLVPRPGSETEPRKGITARRRRLAVTALALVALFSVLQPAPLGAAELMAADPAATVWVRMSALASGIPGSDGTPSTQALNYGAFVWLGIGTAELAGLQASGQPYQVYAEPFTLRLGEQSFDPLQDRVVLPHGWEGGRSDGPDLHLVQLVGPTRDEWLDRLLGDGLEIVQYIHPYTYVVWGDLGDLGRSAQADFVRWSGPFAPAYRVLPRWQDLDDAPVQVDVLLYRGADTAAAIRQIEALGGMSHGRAVLNAVFEIASFALDGTAIQAAAQVSGVYSIQVEPTDGGLRGEMSNQVNANKLDGSNLAFPGYVDWLADIGVDGSGVVIANVDDGIDDTHPDLSGRFLPCTGQTCGGSATSDHGTHTAGIMAADGTSGNTDSYGFLRGLGMAPGASLVEQLYFPWFQQPGGMLYLMNESFINGASLSGNSWGPAATPQGYDNDTMQVDIGVRDADPDTPGNQPLSYILSIMNGHGGEQSQGSPDEAKNILTVGATRMQALGGAQLLSLDNLATTTAHGPALDGRIIPHMVAPGCYVDSTLPDRSYGTMCGTSMASPSVAGAAALFIEQYRNRFDGSEPSPALLKAAFLPVAHDLAGHQDADGNTLGHPFDSKQGWGRLDAASVLDPQAPVAYFDQPFTFDQTGEEWRKTLSVADASRPVRLMLAWTDAPGHGLGGSTPAWNNDLDLVVETGGNRYWGNNFGPDGWSQTGEHADPMNNTEGVFLSPGTAGDFTVRVLAGNINSDGIPNQGDATDQDFGLVCYNCKPAQDLVYYLPLVFK